MTGTVLSQLLPLFFAPVLSRIYLPSDYGLLGLYMSITGIISMMSTLQYANAIVIAKNDEEIKGIIKLSLQILLAFTLISFLVVLIFQGIIANYFKSPALSFWLWLAPISILMGGLSTVFSNYAIRHQHYTLLASNRVLSSVASSLCSLIIGFLTHNVVGLFAGYILGQSISGIFLAISSLRKSKESWSSFFHTGSNSVWKEYINFPKYSLPADFINNFTNQLPVFMLNGYGTIAAVGAYNMSNRLLGLPIGFLSNSVGEVFRQRAAQDFNNLGNCKDIFVKSLKTLSLLSIVPFGVIIFLGEDIFALVLGEKWREAGSYAQIMGVMFFFKFTVSPLTYVYYIANKQKEDFFLHLLFLIVAYLAFYLGYQLFHSTLYSLAIFSVLYSLIYCIYLIRSYHFSKGNGSK